MDKYALIENNVVVQVQTKLAPGFIKVPEHVVCGMLSNKGEFTTPSPTQKPYTDLRREELAQLDGDGMDAIRKAVQALADGLPLPAEFSTYMGKVAAVKAKYPKPVSS